MKRLVRESNRGWKGPFFDDEPRFGPYVIVKERVQRDDVSFVVCCVLVDWLIRECVGILLRNSHVWTFLAEPRLLQLRTGKK